MAQVPTIEVESLNLGLVFRMVLVRVSRLINSVF